MCMFISVVRSFGLFANKLIRYKSKVWTGLLFPSDKKKTTIENTVQIYVERVFDYESYRVHYKRKLQE